MEVLELAIAGKQMDQIATELNIKPAAVRKRLGEVYKKFNISGSGPGKLAKLQQALVANYKSQRTYLPVAQPPSTVRFDWGDAIESDSFVGRNAELNTLKQWVADDACRLVVMWGLGGIGKTTLAIRLAKEMHSGFEGGVWRSLSNLPTLNDLVTDLLHTLSGTIDSDLPDSPDHRIARLLKLLKAHRYLIVLDGADALFQTPSAKDGGETLSYTDFIKQLGEIAHASCILVTTNEKPREFTSLIGSRVRMFHVQGLSEADGQAFFDHLIPSGQTSQEIIRRYRGNPLALKIAASTVRDVFGGEVSEFLSQGATVFGDILSLIEQQFQPLSLLEKTILFWLAIGRDSTPIKDLRHQLVPNVFPAQLLDALESLGRRSLVEQDRGQFSLQPVIAEYVTQQLIERVSHEICSGQIDLLNSHALMQAQTNDHLRETQRRTILQPLVERLQTQLGATEAIAERLFSVLASLRQQSLKMGYAAGNCLNLLVHLEVDLSDRDFSELTIWQAYLPDTKLHGVNFAGSDLSQSIFAETLGGILSVAFSPDGKRLVTGDTDSQVRLWNVESGEKVITLPGHSDWVRCVAYHPNGRQIASGSEDQTIRLWNAKTGQCQLILEGHTSWLRAIAFNPNGTVLASGGDDRTVRLWSISTGECMAVLNGDEGHSKPVRSVAFSPDGNWLASGSSDRTVKLWDVESGQCLKTLNGHSRGVRAVAFSPDGEWLASGSSDTTIQLWSMATAQAERRFEGHIGWVWSLKFSPDGRQLVSGSEDRTVKLWDVETATCLQTLQGHSSWVRAVDFCPTQPIVASGSDDQTVRLWDAASGQRLRTLQGYARGVRSVAFSPDQTLLASGSEDFSIHLWDIAQGTHLATLKKHRSRIWSVAFSADGALLASGSDDMNVRLWDVATGHCVKVLQGHGDGVHSVAFSPDGQWLASSSCDRTIRLWDVITGQCLTILAGHSDWVWSVTFSPDGKTLASGGGDRTVRLWDVATGHCLRIMHGHRNWVRSVAFSPDGKTLASSSVGRAVRLWDVETGECLKIMDGYTKGIRSIAFSPDSHTLVSGSDDNIARIWDIQSGTCLHAFKGHRGRVRTVAFSKDGTLVASGSNDETVKLWNAQTGHELKTLKLDRLYEGMTITNAIGLTDAQQATLIALGAIDQRLLK